MSKLGKVLLILVVLFLMFIPTLVAMKYVAIAQVYSYFVDSIANLLGVNLYLIKAGAILALVPFFFAMKLAFSFKRFNRRIGQALLGLFLVLFVAVSLGYLWIDYQAGQRAMVLASPRSFQTVYKLSRLAAFRLGIALPPIYITQNPSYNAYTRGFHRYGFVVLHSAMVRDFRAPELLFVLGHEMGHMKRFHTTWLTLMQPATVGGSSFLLAPLLRLVFNAWSVKSEYTADQAGLIACRDLQSAAMSTLKLAAGKEIETQVDIDEVIRSGFGPGQLSSDILEHIGTHPFFTNRIRQLVNYGSSSDFAKATTTRSA